jgi:nitrate reductase beta subunit
MDVRAQVTNVFHLDKCIGCHTCSLSCKNIWTDRDGAEYMFWNNVETKPGTGYPTLYEDQEKYQGGWVLKDGKLRLRLQERLRGLINLFFNPHLPTIDDYYEPWTYRYGDLFDSPAGDDQPTARAISRITGEPMNIEAGPNWDDDLSGSPIYAANDPNLKRLSEEEREKLFQLERLVFFYLPRICNHCLNPGCVGACPAGALYKRGEDGIVLVSQEKCRAWRMCISGCPYKKVYYQWKTGKAEKCILCYPRLETGQAPGCFHSCVGRIRYLGVVLYDADRIQEAAMAKDEDLVEAHREILLDPTDPEVVRKAKENGISDAFLEAARKSPTYKLIKEWGIALPLHPEFRTLPMLFYVPPILPVMGTVQKERYDVASEEYFDSLKKARVPMKYMASLLAGGNEEVVEKVYKKLLAVRTYMRSKTVGDLEVEDVMRALADAGCTPDEAEGIYRLTSMPTWEDRFVIPPYQREVSIEAMEDPYKYRNDAGLGFRKKLVRGL